MKRPSVALTMIVKNEVKNMPKLLASVQNCFDLACILDTGSTDGTVEYLKSKEAEKLAGCQIFTDSFEWVFDFSAARNKSLELAKVSALSMGISTKDLFFMWLDGDDVLDGKEEFIKWRDHVMGLKDFWFAGYNYAQNEHGQPVAHFLRERVIRFKKPGLSSPAWKDFLHEGIPHLAGYEPGNALTWEVKHLRTAQDLADDKGRNLGIFKKNMVKGELSPRMQYYYGKELFENKMPMEAYPALLKAFSTGELSEVDRVLCIQYAAYAAYNCQQYDRAIQHGFDGVQLDPTRAEYFNVIVDSYLAMYKQGFDEGRGKNFALLRAAIPFGHAAKNCFNVLAGTGQAGFVNTHPDSYTVWPRMKLAEIYFQLGEFQSAKIEAEECLKLFKHKPAEVFLVEIEKATKTCDISLSTQTEADDIVFSTPPMHAYDWDEEIYKTKGLGGSETACVEMAKYLKKITGKRVIVFGPRKDRWTSESGVEYWPVSETNHYFVNFKPKINIMWRHNVKLTDAPSYLWCHDLNVPGGEVAQNFDKLLCLSNFHRDYVEASQGIKPEKVIVTRNGIEPKRFTGKEPVAKNPLKIIWPSSPDRGLDRAINIIKTAREKYDVPFELHVYYGFDNFYKYGMHDMANQLKHLVDSHDWVKYHGNVDQTTLAKEMAEAAVWLYPASFIETFCISAIEALCSGVYPLVRKIGALQDTLKKAHSDGMATLLDLDSLDESDVSKWAEELYQIFIEKRWEVVRVNPSEYSWESVAHEWVEFLGLGTENFDEIKNVTPIRHKGEDASATLST